MTRIMFAAVLLLAGANAGWAKHQPNIVLFFVDDLGWNNLGYRNQQLFETVIQRRSERDSEWGRFPQTGLHTSFEFRTQASNLR